MRSRTTARLLAPVAATLLAVGLVPAAAPAAPLPAARTAAAAPEWTNVSYGAEIPLPSAGSDDAKVRAVFKARAGDLVRLAPGRYSESPAEAAGMAKTWALHRLAGPKRLGARIAPLVSCRAKAPCPGTGVFRIPRTGSYAFAGAFTDGGRLQKVRRATMTRASKTCVAAGTATLVEINVPANSVWALAGPTVATYTGPRRGAVPLAGRAGGSLVSPVGLESSRFGSPRGMSRSYALVSPRENGCCAPANRQVSLRKLPVVDTAPDTDLRIPSGAPAYASSSGRQYAWLSRVSSSTEAFVRARSSRGTVTSSTAEFGADHPSTERILQVGPGGTQLALMTTSGMGTSDTWELQSASLGSPVTVSSTSPASTTLTVPAEGEFAVARVTRGAGLTRSPWVSGTSTSSAWEVAIEQRPPLSTGSSLCGTGTTLAPGAGVPSNITEGNDYLAVLRAPGTVTLTFAAVWPTEPPTWEC